ncbi:MAG: hypothetical protein EOO73_11575 [Myxococcales bacterium]|nr:MAG: hypothetical protein EOO73_11575 [Myxococcales bacterium]
MNRSSAVDDLRSSSVARSALWRARNLARTLALGAVATALSLSACSLRSLDHLSSGSGGGDALGGSAGNGVMVDGGTTSGSAPVGGAGGMGSFAAAGYAGEPGEAGAPPRLPDCADGDTTVDETDVDCGGRTCSRCGPGQRCFTGTDCTSGICTNQICQPPSCSDLAVNGTETDLNCGGSCPACALGQHCGSNADCAGATCADGICLPTTCQDGVLRDGCPLLVDNAPYSLSPSHATTSCIDDSALSVADGNGMVLYTCKVELHQTFWAVAAEDGYYALRGALSGKCLQVRGASLAAEAVVEHWACNDAPEQQWKPVRVDSEFMQLINQRSGLALDVAGMDETANGKPIVQGELGSTGDTSWRLQRRTSAAYVTLSPYADTTLRIRHDGSEVTVTDDDAETAHWKIVPGLGDSHHVSFQSRDEPGRYLRHSRYRLWSDTYDGSSLFASDATFELTSPLVGANRLAKTLRSLNYPGRNITRTGDTASLSPTEDTAEYKEAATWRIAPR